MLYTIENDTLSVTAETRGAELQSVYHKPAAREALWQGDARYWEGRSPNLFPFVGRLTDGKYRYNGQTYRMPLHGFLHTSETELVEQDPTHMTFRLSDSEATYRDYPFRFECYVTYRLEGNTLHTVYTIKNRGENDLVFGLGGHPGFCVPFAENTSFEDYSLSFPVAENPVRILFDDAVLRTGGALPCPLDGGSIPLRHELFSHDAVVLSGAGDRVRICTGKSKRFIEVRYPDMPQVGFWHAQGTDAPYVCVEPWATLPARAAEITDFSTSNELLRLSSGAEYRNSFSVTISF